MFIDFAAAIAQNNHGQRGMAVSHLRCFDSAIAPIGRGGDRALLMRAKDAPLRDRAKRQNT
jgi:hypothetical protein|tara:strand:- start:14002 stop:14184 length:183 start_codon:yes stop_codon:yes gene_type:complete